MRSSHPDAAAWLRLDSADRLFGEVVGLATPLELPGTWRPFPELQLELHAAPSSMTTHYLGWVHLPTPLTIPVPRERAVSFGRGSRRTLPRACWRIHGHCAGTATPRKRSASTLNIWGCRAGICACRPAAMTGGCNWKSQNMPVYRLTPAGELLDVLNPGVNTAAAKPGELLVAGGYVLALGTVV